MTKRKFAIIIVTAEQAKGVIGMFELLAANPSTGVDMDPTLIIVSGVVVVACIAVGLISKFTKKK